MQTFMLYTIDSDIFSEQIAAIKAKNIIDIIFTTLMTEFI